MNSILSFFTGAGFLDLGFEHAGFSVDMVNEYCPTFLEGYRHSRKVLGSPLPKYGHHLGSLEDFFSDEYADRLSAIIADIRRSGKKVGMVGGPPCPDFSIAGKNAGYEGDNGRLTVAYFDLIKACRPDFFVFENVAGLWKTHHHRPFYDHMKETLLEAGFTLHDRLINAVSYGVGQDRQRIFLVGVLGDGLADDFPWGISMRYDPSILKLKWPKTDRFVEGAMSEFPADKGLPRDLTVQHWFEQNDVSNHPNALMSFKPVSARIREVEEGDVKRKSFKRLHRWRYGPTAAYGNNEVHLHPYLPRRISVAEALAIQSLPKEFELPDDMPLSYAFKTIGNGVPYLAAKGLGDSVSRYLRG